MLAVAAGDAQQCQREARLAPRGAQHREDGRDEHAELHRRLLHFACVGVTAKPEVHAVRGRGGEEDEQYHGGYEEVVVPPEACSPSLLDPEAGAEEDCREDGHDPNHGQDARARGAIVGSDESDPDDGCG